MKAKTNQIHREELPNMKTKSTAMTTLAFGVLLLLLSSLRDILRRSRILGRFSSSRWRDLQVVLRAGLVVCAWLASASFSAAESLAELSSADMGSSRGNKRPLDERLFREFVNVYDAVGADDYEVFVKYVGLLGGEAILGYLEETFPLCHSEAHQLGVAIYASSKDLGSALLTCGHRCTSGCMHGVIREAFGKKTLEEVKSRLEEFCESGAMSNHKPGNCAHSLGHAVMIASGRDLKRSLEACSSYPSEGMGYYCAAGVYMEYFMEPPDLNLKPVSLHYPCDTQTLYPAACYRYLGPVMLEALHDDAGRLAAECLALSGARRLGCFHGLGSAHTRQVSRKPGLLGNVCQFGTADDRKMCIEGTIEKLADMNESIAAKACVKLSGDDARTCLEALNGKMYRLDKATLSLYTRP